MHTIYIDNNYAIQVESIRTTGSVYSVNENLSFSETRYFWVPKGNNVPGGATQCYSTDTISTTHVIVWFGNIDTVKEALIKFIATYKNLSYDIWSDDEIHYTDTFKISDLEFNRYAEFYLPDTACLRSKFPYKQDDGERAGISAKLYVVDKVENNTELSSLDERLTSPSFEFSMIDPAEDIIGLEALRSGNHIDVEIKTMDKTAFAKKYNHGYACYTISQYVQDGMVDTSSTISGVAERRKVKSEKFMISLDDVISSETLRFMISPTVADIAVSEIVVEASAAFWYDDGTTLEDMHTGIVDTHATYITRDPMSLTDKIPLANGFYDVTWEDALVLYDGSAEPFIESRKYDHVNGPSTLNVYNCIKVAEHTGEASKSTGYTLFKIQVDKEQAISTPTSIIVPYHDVICTVGVAALENIDSQSDTSRNDIWTSQK